MLLSNAAMPPFTPLLRGSRAFVRAVADDALLPVPSPTYLLLQAYEDHAGPCAPCGGSLALRSARR